MADDLNGLAAFRAVAEERSFTRAAARLGVSQPALSNAMRVLEQRLGVQLLARTTRSVSPTAAGAEVLRELTPSLERIERSLMEVRKKRRQPAGRIRMALSRSAAQLVLLPRMMRFLREYPEVVLDITVSNDPVDLVAGEYDCGIQIGEFIQRDMIAVPVSEELRLAVVGSPAYLQKHPAPKTPRDLKDHACLGFRFRSGIYRWEFEKGRRSITFHPQGPLIFDDPGLLLEAVEAGAGLSVGIEQTMRKKIAAGKLVQVLEDWCPQFPGFFLYYPSRRNQPAALTALVRSLRLSR